MPADLLAPGRFRNLHDLPVSAFGSRHLQCQCNGRKRQDRYLAR